MSMPLRRIIILTVWELVMKNVLILAILRWSIHKKIQYISMLWHVPTPLCLRFPFCHATDVGCASVIIDVRITAITNVSDAELCRQRAWTFARTIHCTLSRSEGRHRSVLQPQGLSFCGNLQNFKAKNTLAAFIHSSINQSNYNVP